MNSIVLEVVVLWNWNRTIIYLVDTVIDGGAE